MSHDNNRKRLFGKAALLMILIPFFCGCGASAEKKDPPFDKWRTLAEQSQGHSPPSRTRSYALKEPVDVSPHEIDDSLQRAMDEFEKGQNARPLPTQKISITMRNTEVGAILRALARAVDRNIMISAAVSGVSSVSVSNTPWNQVFKALLATRGLTYTWEGDIIRVMSIEDMRHELEMERVRKERTAQIAERQDLEPWLTRIVPVRYADANQLQGNLEKLLDNGDADRRENAGGRGRARVIVDDHNNALIVHARKSQMETIMQVILQLDRAIAQIRIEANIVETTRDTARQLGIEWGGLYHAGDGWITPGARAGGVSGSSVDTPVNPTADGPAARFPADFIAEDMEGLTLGYVGQKVGSYLLDVELSALQREGKLNILSRPSITTLDNQMAFTESGEKIPYVSSSTLGESEVKFENAVLRLEITPHVIDGEHLKMKVVIKKDAVDDSRSVEGNPFIIKKQTETTLIVKDGETIVISGLTRQQDSEIENGVPFLKDMPLMGSLFRSRSNSGTMEDVLVFITPHILGPAGVE